MTTPGHVRTARSKAALEAAGGRRLTLNLGPEAALALEQIRDRHGALTERNAVEQALCSFAKKLNRRQK